MIAVWVTKKIKPFIYSLNFEITKERTLTLWRVRGTSHTAGTGVGAAGFAAMELQWTAQGA